MLLGFSIFVDGRCFCITFFLIIKRSFFFFTISGHNYSIIITYFFISDLYTVGRNRRISKEGIRRHVSSGSYIEDTQAQEAAVVVIVQKHTTVFGI